MRKDSLTENEKIFGSKLLWIYGIGCFALANAVHIFIFYAFFTRKLAHSDWYFIINDFLGGAAMLAYLIICVIAGLSALRKGNAQGRLLIMFSSIWAAVPIWESLVIMLKTKNMFNSSTRTSVWHTYDQYLLDRDRFGGWLILVFILLVTFFLAKFKWAKEKISVGRSGL